MGSSSLYEAVIENCSTQQKLDPHMLVPKVFDQINEVPRWFSRKTCVDCETTGLL